MSAIHHLSGHIVGLSRDVPVMEYVRGFARLGGSPRKCKTDLQLNDDKSGHYIPNLFPDHVQINHKFVFVDATAWMGGDGHSNCSNFQPLTVSIKLSALVMGCFESYSRPNQRNMADAHRSASRGRKAGVSRTIMRYSDF
jgi:hypothetical protein